MKQVKITTTSDLINGGCNACPNVKCTNYLVHVEDETIALETLTVADLVTLLALKEGFRQKLVMEIAKVVRVGYLQQNAFHKDDTYVPLAKQLKMMDVILYLNKKCQEAVAQGKVVRAISETGIFEQLIKMKYDIPNDHIEKLDTYYQDIDNALKSVA